MHCMVAYDYLSVSLMCCIIVITNCLSDILLYVYDDLWLPICQTGVLYDGLG